MELFRIHMLAHTGTALKYKEGWQLFEHKSCYVREWQLLRTIVVVHRLAYLMFTRSR